MLARRYRDARKSWSKGSSRLPSRVMRRHRVSVQLDPAGSVHGRGVPRPSGSELLPSQLHTLGPNDHHATWTVSGLL